LIVSIASTISAIPLITYIKVSIQNWYYKACKNEEMEKSSSKSPGSSISSAIRRVWTFVIRRCDRMFPQKL
ncbi:MAG: hypothetical protein J5U19_16110, partial [Candidatus Methanoperedens sp.]|nr:hypothetical protein [Candidatus Methanoperedens sp.]